MLLNPVKAILIAVMLNIPFRVKLMIHMIFINESTTIFHFLNSAFLGVQLCFSAQVLIARSIYQDVTCFKNIHLISCD